MASNADDQQLSVSGDFNLKRYCQQVQITITEEPATNRLQFRSPTEPRSGVLMGERSTGDRRTFPKIRIDGYRGPAEVVVSCVEHAPSTGANTYRPHPHKIRSMYAILSSISISIFS